MQSLHKEQVPGAQAEPRLQSVSPAPGERGSAWPLVSKPRCRTPTPRQALSGDGGAHASPGDSPVNTLWLPSDEAEASGLLG